MASDFGHGLMSDAVQAAAMGAGQQGAHLAGMINQAQNAIQAENESRVAQERERRRMEHEKEMMRMQMDQQERQAQLLARLQAQRQSPAIVDPTFHSNGFQTDHYGRIVDSWRT